MPARVVVAGGTGFLGRALVDRLAGSGHEVVVLTRRPRSAPAEDRVRDVAWNPDVDAPDGGPGSWVRELEGAGAVVNLAGAGLADRRWTSARKAVLRSSRILSTRALVGAIRAASRRPSVFVQGSAVGYYGSTGDRILDETAPAGDDFLARLAADWEAEAGPVTALGCRLATIRTGVVLGAGGGALVPLRRAFSFFVGGPVLPGTQYMSWIHLDDWTSLVLWTIERSIEGVVNGSAPNPVTNAVFSRALGRALHRPSWLPVPGFALRLAVGEVADVALIAGQRVMPTRALDLGFTFTYPEIDAAMAAAVR